MCHANWFRSSVLGFLLMSGGASEDPTKFSQDIFSFEE